MTIIKSGTKQNLVKRGLYAKQFSNIEYTHTPTNLASQNYLPPQKKFQLKSIFPTYCHEFYGSEGWQPQSDRNFCKTPVQVKQTRS